MLNTIVNINRHTFDIAKYQITSRHLFRWLIIIFNGVDKKRIEKVGPDRACAEWLLRNGAFVKSLDAVDYLKDYNLIPKENNNFHIQKIDATDSAIHHVGFPHFSGCKHIEEIKIVRCPYIYNEALSLLSLIKDSLKVVEVLECGNITHEGLQHLKNLIHLKTLKLGGLPEVKNKSNILLELSKELPNCQIIYN